MARIIRNGDETVSARCYPFDIPKSDALGDFQSWVQTPSTVNVADSSLYYLPQPQLFIPSATPSMGHFLCSFVDYCDGPSTVTLNEPYSYRWKTFFDGESVVFHRLDLPPQLAPTEFFLSYKPHHISVCFDHTSNPVWACQSTEDLGTLNGFRLLHYSGASRTPVTRLFLGDSPRLFFTGVPDCGIPASSWDVHLFYIRAGKLRCRIQRDNWNVEYTFDYSEPITYIGKADVRNSRLFVDCRATSGLISLASDIYRRRSVEHSDGFAGASVNLLSGAVASVVARHPVGDNGVLSEVALLSGSMVAPILRNSVGESGTTYEPSLVSGRRDLVVVREVVGDLVFANSAVDILGGSRVTVVNRQSAGDDAPSYTLTLINGFRS